MAETDRAPTVDELVARLDRARNRIAGDIAATRAASDVASRARAAFHAHTWRWIAGATLVGIAATHFGFRRKKRVARGAVPVAPPPARSGFAAVLAVLVPILQPALTAVAKRAVAEWVTRRDRR